MTTEKELIVIPEPVLVELTKQEIVENKLRKEAETCMQLKLASLDDKEGYLVITDKRKMLKRTRVAITKIFKADRDQVNLRIKANSKAEDELLSILTPAEAYLEEQESAYEGEQARIRKQAEEEIARAEEERLEAIRKAEEDRQKKIQTRQQDLNKTGAVLDEGAYTVGNVMVTEDAVINGSDEVFTMALDCFRVEAEKIKLQKKKESEELQAKLKEVAEQELKQKEERAKLDREKAEFEKEQREAREKKEQEEREAKEKAEREKREEEKKLYTLGKNRLEVLQEYGLKIKDNATIENEINQLALKTEKEFNILRADWVKVAEDNKKHELAKKEALKPDKERLTETLTELGKFKVPALKTDEGKRVAMEFASAFKDLITDFKAKVKNL